MQKTYFHWLVTILIGIFAGIFSVTLNSYFSEDTNNTEKPLFSEGSLSQDPKAITSRHQDISTEKLHTEWPQSPAIASFSYANQNSFVEFPTSFSLAVQIAAPAVVNIYTTKNAVPRSDIDTDPMTQIRARVASSLGSGVIVSHNGYILTNHHVIRDADQIFIMLQDGRETIAEIIGTDPETDLALLHINLPNLPAIALKDSSSTRVGDVVLAIGNPYGLGQAVSMGIVSAKGRSGLNLSTFEEFIQTDAAINRGSSGGALIDSYGNLIGINTALYTENGGSLGIGFATPATLAQKVMFDILQQGRVTRGWLGILPQALDASLAQAYGLPEISGIIIKNIIAQSPADTGKLKIGDIITHINNQPLINEIQALRLIASFTPGESIVTAIIRDGKIEQKSILVGERPTPKS